MGINAAANQTKTSWLNLIHTARPYMVGNANADAVAERLTSGDSATRSNVEAFCRSNIAGHEATVSPRGIRESGITGEQAEQLRSMLGGERALLAALVAL